MNSMISFEPLPRMRCSRVQAELVRERLAQIVAAAVGIKMRTRLNALLHRRERLGRRAERVFVRGELDDCSERPQPSSRAVSSIGLPGS